MAQPVLAQERNASDRHVHADAILFPAFVAVLNEYALQHPSLTDMSHYRKLDAKDLKRWRAVREAFKTLDDAMRDAGY